MTEQEKLPSPPLSPKEIEILQEIADGHTSHAEIANELNTTPANVGRVLSEVYRKLKVRSKTEAVMKALRQGIVELGEDPE